jgi:indole-3-glycerol phosphate synthase
MSILDRIVESKRQEITAAKATISAAELTAKIRITPPPLEFFTACTKPDRINVIAEVKKASPSAGVIRPDFDPVAIAKAYEAHGAACLSVLTDEPFFQGSLAYLRAVKQAVSIPVLRKEFIIDRYQLLEARAAGADAVLLIAEILPDPLLNDLYAEARSLGLTVLLELHDADQLDRCLATGCPLIGINNRDLRTFHTDLNHTVRMRQRIPANVAVVGESGIRTPDDVRLLQSAGVNTILVGESLMRETDIGQALRKLIAI